MRMGGSTVFMRLLKGERAIRDFCLDYVLVNILQPELRVTDER